ncbi:MAG: serine/threonine protein [Planctomycetota bacterium]|nr:MAG: serine/threonine protein [Planctomycetota bacterium]
MHRESDLLFALLALHHALAPREAVLGSIAVWLADSTQPLPEHLAAAASLSRRRRKAIEALLDAALEEAAGDAARALSQTQVDPALARELVELRLPPHLQVPLLAAAERAPGTTAADGTRYRLGTEIGRGGLGRVVEAQDSRLGREVAIKLVIAAAPEHVSGRFEREARLTARLDHPHVVPVHDFGAMTADGTRQLFLCMKRIHGRDLGSLVDLIAKEDPAALDAWSRARLLGVFQDICLGVAYAHSKDVIHRDLKPSNVMIGEFGETLVVDWGLAKVLGETEPVEVSRALQRITTTARHAQEPELPVGEVLPRAPTLVSAAARPKPPLSHHDATVVPGRTRPASTSLTLEGDILGTPAYMPPEQASGRIAEMDARSDIWSLGAILYELLTLGPPFAATTLEEVMAKVKEGKVEPPSSRAAHRQAARTGKPHPFLAPVPAELDAIVARAMGLRRESRYASALDLHRDVQLFLEGVKERERSEREAREFAETGQRELAAFRALGEKFNLARETSKRVERELHAAATAEARRPAWDAEDEVHRLESQRIDAFTRANAAFSAALARRPDSREALDGKCDLFIERYLDAERRRDRSEMQMQWNVLGQYDLDGRARARLQAPGKLTLRAFRYTCDCLKPVKKKGWGAAHVEDERIAFEDGVGQPRLKPPPDSSVVPRIAFRPKGARWGHRHDCPREEVKGIGITIARFEEKDRRFVAVSETLIGKTPLAGAELARGSYRCVLIPSAASGLAPAVVPVKIDRGGKWEQDVRLYAIDDIPAGHLYVPGGPFASGPQAGDPGMTGDVFMRRDAVTCREYLDYVNDLCAEGRLAEARSRLPRGTDRPYFVEEKKKGKVRFRLPDRKEDPQLAWEDTWPACAMSWHDALAWCAWESARTGVVVSIPSGHEFEKASRGVDGRAFPFGDHGDMAFSNVSRGSRGVMGPAPVGTAPADISVYGVRDLAGNMKTWCLDCNVDPKRPARGTRGGAWSMGVESGHSAEVGGLPSTGRRWFIGFRTVVRPQAWE